MAEKNELTGFKASIERIVAAAETLHVKDLSEEGQNSYMDFILLACRLNDIHISLTFGIGMRVIGKRALTYLWGKIPYEARLAEYEKIETKAETATDLRKSLSNFRETLLGDAPHMITKEKERGTGETATEFQREGTAYAVEIIKTDFQTGEVSRWTDKKRFKTRKGADRAVARWSSICRPDGRTAVSETMGRVVAAN
jgi:hypothetical protein